MEPLARGHVRAVYPLIREAIPGITLNAWLRFARTTVGGNRSGIIVARRTGRDFPSGLFCYRVEREPAGTRVLVAEHLVAVDLLHPDDVLDALTAELEQLAQRLDCASIRSLVRRPDVAGGLARAGHAEEGSLLEKVLGRDPASC